jgi:cold-inducible RNA-binding protein
VAHVGPVWFEGACVAKRIYVGNLPYSVDNQQLASLFGEYGQVTDATVITDRDSGQSKGFGFVEMANDAEAFNAISQLNGSQMGNRTLRVNEAQPRVERQGGGRGYGRDSYGGGGYGGGGRSGGRRDDYRGERSWGSYDTGYDAGSQRSGGRRNERSW